MTNFQERVYNIYKKVECNLTKNLDGASCPITNQWIRKRFFLERFIFQLQITRFAKSWTFRKCLPGDICKIFKVQSAFWLDFVFTWMIVLLRILI